MTKDAALKLGLQLVATAEYLATDAEICGKDAKEERALIQRSKIAFEEALAQPEQEPVAWLGLDLDNMAEAFHRVIEEHHSRKYPFHDPVNRDAMIALRELRGLIAYMKRNTTPPQREPLTDEEISDMWCEVSNTDFVTGDTHVFARAIEAAHGIKE